MTKQVQTLMFGEAVGQERIQFGLMQGTGEDLANAAGPELINLSQDGVGTKDRLLRGRAQDRDLRVAAPR